MLSRRVAVATLVLVPVLVGIAAWFARARVAFSSPTAMRNDGSYRLAHAPGTNLPAFREEVFKSVTIEKIPGGLTVTFATGGEALPAALYGTVTSHRAAEGTEAIQIGDGSIRLAYIGVVTERPQAVPMGSYSMRAPAKYYTADLKPVQEDGTPLPNPLPSARGEGKEERSSSSAKGDGKTGVVSGPLPPRGLTEKKSPASQITRQASSGSGKEKEGSILNLEPYRLGMDASTLPAARFIFACSNLTEFRTWRFHTFDARTHYTLSDWRYFQTAFRDTISFNTAMKVWHQTPIEVVVTLAMGPAESYSMAAVEGTELRGPFGGIKLLAITEGRLEEMFSGHGAPRNKATFTKASGSAEEEPAFSLVFYCWPPAGALPWEFEFYNGAGKEMSSGYQASGRGAAIRAVTGSPEQLKEIRVKYYPNLHRLSFTIPELPGLPEENRNVQNLFDVRIPHISGQSSYPQNIGDVVQMQVRLYVSHSQWTECTNTTARALLEELEGYVSKDYRLVVDAEKNEIRWERRFLAGPLNFVKGVLRIR